MDDYCEPLSAYLALDADGDQVEVSGDLDRLERQEHILLATPPAALRLREEGRNQFYGRLISAGRVRNTLNQPGDLLITAESIRDALTIGLFENLACFIDHAPERSNPSLRNLLGVWHDVAWNPLTKSADGTLTVYSNEETRPLLELISQMLADQERSGAVPDVGVSLSFYGEWEETADFPRVLRQFYQVESADLVFFPAADGRILRALSALNGGESGYEDRKSISQASSDAGRGRTFASEDAKLSGEDANLSGESSALNGGGQEAEHGKPISQASASRQPISQASSNSKPISQASSDAGRGRTFASEDAKLSGEDAKLSGRDTNLSRIF